MGEAYTIGPFVLDTGAKVLSLEGQPVALGRRAVTVLEVLVLAAGAYVAKERLLEAAWPGVVVEENNLSVQISAIRRVLALAPGGESWLETLARRGYRFAGPAAVPARMAAAPPADTDPRSNLPEALTSFIGREREMAQVRELLSEHRLVTLTGAGGIGKTRLALEVAAGFVASYRDGVWLVELAALSDPRLVPKAVVKVFGLKERAEKNPTQMLIEHLRARQALLVLDNAEHVLAGCAQFVDDLLRRCPQAVLLVTSREALSVPGELTYRVPSLSTPEARRGATVQHIGDYESVRLFHERARLQVPQFAVTDRNAPALASICHHLDGIALAIELAAARVRSMSVEELNQRLGQRFRLLTGGSRTAPRRHQTLRAAIDWSHDLLADSEKTLLDRLSVFAGGATLDAVERVCCGDGIETCEVLDLLTSLVDKNLVAAEEYDGATRYRLLETVRQYASERLHDGGEAARLRRQHLQYFLGLAERAEPHLRGTDQHVWLDRLEVEHENLRAGLTWSSTGGEGAAGGLRMAGAIWWFWLMRGHMREGREWLTALLAAVPDGEVAAARAKALNAAGALARLQGDQAAARKCLEQSLEIRRALGDQRGIARSLGNLGNLAGDHGDHATSRQLYEQALALFRELGDHSGMGNTLNNLGLVAYVQGDYVAARALYEEGLALWKELGDRQGIATALSNLGNMASDQGDHPAARLLYEEGLSICRELGDKWNIANLLNNLGTLAFDSGDCHEARERFAESLAVQRELDSGTLTAASLEGLAYVAAALGAAALGCRIWGSAEHLREEIGRARLPPIEQSRHDRQVDRVRTAMADDTAFDLAWRQGRALTIGQAIECALSTY